jgi:ubiquinone biosynthesis protein UbiJ
MERFRRDVQTLRDDVDRADARLRRIEKQRS